MNGFIPLNTKGGALRIEHGTAGVSVYAHDKYGVVTLVVIANADIPAVAAELLKAAGHGNLADLAGWESAEKKLRERRDAVALSLSGVASYTQQVQTTRKAIDRIIELEDGK